MIRKITLLFFVLVFVISMVACGDKQNNTKETGTPQLHTMVPRKRDAAEEWCRIYADLTLKDKNKNDILTTSDFDSFTLRGNTDSNSFITIKVNDEALDMLKFMYKTQKGETISLYIGNKKLCDIKFTDEILNGSINIGKDQSYSTLCKWSSSLRGL